MNAKQGSLRLARILSRWGAPALLVALPLMWLWRLVFAGQVLYWGIPLQQFYPWRLLVVEGWLAGLPPLWNSWLGAGTPLLANHQSASLYPLNFIFLLFPVERAIGYSVLLHLALAGLAMYAYAGRLGLTKGGRVLAALAFAFGGYIVARVNFLTMICAIAWLPLAMWAGDLLGRKPTLRRAVVLAAVLALQFLAGHIQLWYYTLWLVGAYVLYQAWASPEGTEGRRERWRGLARAGLLFIAAVGLGVLLSAAQMLPTAELARESQRQGGAAYEFAMTYSFWPWRLITLVVPDFFGNPGHGDYWGYGNYWEDAAYVGLLPLFLALYAGWRWWRSRGRGGTEGREGGMGVVPFFLAAVPVSILLALGDNFPLYPLVFRWVPGFGFFQAPARLLCWYAFAVAALAGIGWDLLRRSPRLERVARLLCVVAVGVMVAALAARLALPDVQHTFGPALLQTGALAVGVSLLLMWRARLDRAGSRRWQLWQGVALGLVALDLFLFSLPLVPATDPALYHRPTETAAFLSQDPEPFRTYTFAQTDYQIRYKRYLLFNDFGPSDVDFLMGLRETLLPNLGLVEGIASAGNFDPLLVGRYERFMDAVNEVPLDMALRLLGLMNVRYVLEPGELGRLEPPYARADINVYDNPHALPRGWVAPHARVISDPEALLAALQEEGHGPRSQVLLETPAPLPADPSHWPSSAEPALQYHPSGVTIDVTLAEPGYLCLSQTFYPGWQAWVDGDPADLVRGNYLFQAIPLAAGPHCVELLYRPVSFLAGAVISLAAWAACAVVAVLGWRRRQRQPG